jgi:methylated-DNA-protein-cysteine methyltransferase-like protein
MSGSHFFDKVYNVVRKIPRGRVTSYGAIAEYVGTGLSARMVGWAMNASHRSFPPVPAQRVLNRSGLLTGRHHFSTPVLMQELLEAEGLTIHENQVQNFNKYFWDPSVELRKKKEKPFRKKKK